MPFNVTRFSTQTKTELMSPVTSLDFSGNQSRCRVLVQHLISNVGLIFTGVSKAHNLV